jgi:hypothetical protein
MTGGSGGSCTQALHLEGSNSPINLATHDEGTNSDVQALECMSQHSSGYYEVGWVGWVGWVGLMETSSFIRSLPRSALNSLYQAHQLQVHFSATHCAALCFSNMNLVGKFLVGKRPRLTSTASATSATSRTILR